LDKHLMTLDDMLLEHVLFHTQRSHSWDDDLLHISDIGQCPRMTMLRLMGEQKREVFGEEKRKKQYMFYLANWLHDECYAAWGEQGILIEKECSIRGYLPPGWTGRFDAVIDYEGGFRIADVKTKAYIGKTAQFPQLKHMFQVAAYHMFLRDDWKLTLNPLLFYIQRDLQHFDARECAVDVTASTEAYVMSKMNELEAARADLPNLPNILPRMIKYTGKKVKGQYAEISACTNHDCTSEWCDYSGATCCPDVGEDLIAWRNGDEWCFNDDPMSELYRNDVLEFLEKEAMDEYTGG